MSYNRDLGFKYYCRNTVGLRWFGLILDAYTGWTYHRDWPWYFWWALGKNFANRHPWCYRTRWWWRTLP